LVDDSSSSDPVSSEVGDDSTKAEHILVRLLSKERAARVSELVTAIEFLRKTATER
jgi:hypothetical protein